MIAGSGSSRSVEQAQARFGQDAFAGWLGVTVREVAHERAVLVLPFRPEHLNDGAAFGINPNCQTAVCMG